MRRAGLIKLICSLVIIAALAAAVAATVVICNPFARGHLTITSGDASATYSGRPLMSGDWEITDGELMEGHEIFVTVTGSQTGAGSSENHFNVVIKDADGDDVTDQYNIDKIPGILDVRPRSLTVKAGDDSKCYDGTPLTTEKYILESDLINGDKIDEIVIGGSITDIGNEKSYVETIKIVNSLGEDVTKNYNIKTEEGYLIVYPENTIIIATGSAEKEYDGTPLTNNEWWLVEEVDFPENHKLEVTLTGTITEPGFVLNTFVAKVIDTETGNSVTHLYNIAKDESHLGTLIVKKRSVTIVTGSGEQSFNGLPLTNSNVAVIPTTGDFGDITYEVEVTGSQTEIGESQNTIGDYKFFFDGKDVTDFFEVNKQEGTLKVHGSSGYGNIGIGGGTDSNRVVLRVTTQNSDLIYLKSASYGTYTKVGWNTATAYTGTPINSAASESAFFATAYGVTNTTGMSFVSTCRIESLTGIYVLPYYVWGDVASSSSDVYFEGDIKALENDFYYACWDFTPSASLTFPQNASAAMAEYAAYVTAEDSEYLAIDNETRDFFDNYAREKGINKNSPTIITDVANVIKLSARYNLDYNKELDYEENIAVAFISEYKEGICQHYASAATLLYRTLGIPARYTTGFAAQTLAGKTTDVLAKMAHAWVEVYVDGIGWVNVEVTGSGSPALGEDSFDITVTPENSSARASLTQNGFDPTDAAKVVGFDKLKEAGYRYEVEVKAKDSDDGKYHGIGYSTSIVTVFRIFEKFEDTEYLVYEYKDGVETQPNSRFKVTYKEGSIHRYIAELYFSSESFNGLSKTYDGKPLEFTAAFTSGELVEGEVITALPVDSDYKFIISAKEIINYCIASNADFDVKVMKAEIDQNGNKTYSLDVTDQYKIVERYGLISVNKRQIDVTAPSAEKEYDGTPLTSNDYLDLIIAEGTPLAVGDEIASAVISGQQTQIGDSDNRLISVEIKNGAGKIVTDNYIINKHDGRLYVTAEKP